MFPLLALAPALAEPVEARVRGVGNASAVVVLIEAGGVTDGVRCHDGPVDTPDGEWVCAPLPPLAGTVRLGVLKDGRALDGGEVTLSGARVFMDVRGGALILGATAGQPLTGAPGTPSPGLPTLLARVIGSQEGSAPVLRLQGVGGSSQIWCRNDGVFPDRVRNDTEQGCAGPAPGATVPGGWGAELSLNASDGSSRSFGVVRWDVAATFAYATIDAEKGTLDAAPFPVPGLSPDAKLESEAPEPIPVAPEDPAPPPPPPQPDGQGAEHAPAPPPREGPARELEPAPVDARSPVETKGVPPLAILAAALLGGAGALSLRVRSGRVPSSLKLLPSPELYPGGPMASESAVTVRAADSRAAALAILHALARTRRVIVVMEEEDVGPVAAGPAYRCVSTDSEVVESAVRALLRMPGPALTLLVVDDALTDLGAVAPSPVRRLREALPPSVGIVWITQKDVPPGFVAHLWPGA